METYVTGVRSNVLLFSVSDAYNKRYISVYLNVFIKYFGVGLGLESRQDWAMV